MATPVKEGVFDPAVGSVQLYREGWKLSYPVIELNGEVPLVLSFDLLKSHPENLVYRIIHCDSEWNPSRISEAEYLDGSLQNFITDYTYSFNTGIPYIHYSLNLPNEEMIFRISGNYLIRVYSDYSEEHLLFSRKFMISEKLVSVQMDVKRPVLGLYRDNSQEIDFSVQYGPFPVNDPYQDIRVVMLQNGRWDNALYGLKPLFDRNGTLDYDYQSENVFPGGHEFRWFDIKSLRYQSPYIQSIDYKESRYHVNLFPEEIRSGGRYFYNEDLNGKYFIEVQEQPNDDTDADYVNVNFRLPVRFPAEKGDYYIHGALTNWSCDENSRMKYDSVSNTYHNTLLLKQGYYNYHLVWAECEDCPAKTSELEGDFYETENDYIILVYHYGLGSRYERLIGFQTGNSVYKNR